MTILIDLKNSNDLNTLLNIKDKDELKKLENATMRYFLIQHGKMAIENKEEDEELKKRVRGVTYRIRR